jgi:tripartite-type tricarboxylate transporter receptor subunit TctC
MKRGLFLILLLSLLVLGLASGAALAAYPEKPVNVIIAFTAGGSSDVQARIMQKYWDKYAPRQWNFIYKPGAGGAIGFAEIAKSPKDGYSIGGVNVPHLIIQPLVQKAQFTLNDFDYLCQVVTDPQMVVVRKDSPHKSVADLAAWARANPKKLRLGLVGPNSGHHLMYLEFIDKYDFPVTHIFYQGAADQNAALLGGEIDAMFGNLNDVMRSIEEMRVLGIAAEKRDTVFVPGAPTLREQGYDIVSDIRRAFVAPKGIPPDALEYLRATFGKIGADADYIADMRKAGQPHDYLTGEEFRTYMGTQNARIAAILTKAGVLKATSKAMR